MSDCLPGIRVGACALSAAFVTCALVAGPAPALATAAKGFAVLYAFKGVPDGATPLGGIILGSKGRLIGSTSLGGTSSPPSGGAGTVFSLSKKGTGYVETVLHDFGADGYYPSTAPTLDASGNLYVTTQSGPANTGAAGGVVALSPSGNSYNETEVFHFNAANGAMPASQPLEVNDGSSDIFPPPMLSGTVLYTTTFGGGPSGLGSLAALQLDLTYFDAYSFLGVGSGDGAAPVGNLQTDPMRSVYGATSEGGSGPSPGYGTVFKYVPDTGVESVLYRFAGGNSDGAYPTSGVVLDVAGDIYGTTQLGGAHNLGVLFKLTPAGGGTYTATILHTFGASGDGASPYAAPVLTISQDTLYGTTFAGGTNGAGTLYQISSTGTGYKVLYNFSKSTGSQPGYGSLLLVGNDLYGTTEAGGSANQGVVYRFIP